MAYSFYSDTSTVTVHVRRLRAKIEADPDAPRCIETVWGVGYRFARSRDPRVGRRGARPGRDRHGGAAGSADQRGDQNAVLLAPLGRASLARDGALLDACAPAAGGLRRQYAAGALVVVGPVLASASPVRG